MTGFYLVRHSGRELWVVAWIETDFWAYLPRTGTFCLNDRLGREYWARESLDFVALTAEDARGLIERGVGRWEPDDLDEAFQVWESVEPMAPDMVFALVADAEANPPDYDALQLFLITGDHGEPHWVAAATSLDVWTYVANTGRFHLNEAAWEYVFDRNEYEYVEITVEQARQLMAAGVGTYDESEDAWTIANWLADTDAREPDEVFERVLTTLARVEDLDRTRLLFHVRDATAFGLCVAALLDDAFWAYVPATGKFHLDEELRHDYRSVSLHEYVEITVDEARDLLLHGIGAARSTSSADTEALEPEAVFDLIATAPSSRVGTYLVKTGRLKVGVAVLAGDRLYRYVANTGRFHEDDALRYDFFQDRQHDYERISVIRAQYLISRGIGRLDPVDHAEALTRWTADPTSLDPTEAFLLVEALES
jgi:hypothetical protein